jgi:hypothetical protein
MDTRGSTSTASNFSILLLGSGRPILASPAGYVPTTVGVGDGYYAKEKIFEAIDQVRAYLITRLRSDANLRYQFGFVIRDASRHTGLTHCQARSEEKIDFHLNMSVAGARVLRLLAQKQECSLHTYRREALGRMLVDRLLSKLGLSAEFERSDPRIQEVVRTGRVAV